MTRLGRSLVSFFLLAAAFLSGPWLSAQQQLGRIVGQLRVTKGDSPPHPILVELQLHGSVLTSVYADDQGRFGFYSLGANPYHVVITDSSFHPVDELAIVNPVVSPTTMVQIRLDPVEATKKDPLPGRSGGSNPYMIDLADYSQHFPKKAVKEFEKGVQSDREGKHEDAIGHYQNALQVAPEFYQAHNNLGSDYLSKSDFPGARKEFEQASRINQSDAAAYFNLSNVCMLMGELPEARRYLDEGMRRQPDAALGRFLEGTLNIRLGNLPQAEGSLRQAIQLDPLMAQSRLQLVNLLLQQGRKADAAAQLHDFVTAFPDGPFSPQAKDLLKRLESPQAQPMAK